MKLLTALITVAAIAAGTADARDLAMIEGAYEATLGSVTLPQSTAGTTILKPCPECDSVGIRVDSRTVFQIAGQSLPLPDFLGLVDEVRGRDGGDASLVAIYYHLETNVVTAINVLPSR